jgi:hypothetical protein
VSEITGNKSSIAQARANALLNARVLPDLLTRYQAAIAKPDSNNQIVLSSSSIITQFS